MTWVGTAWTCLPVPEPATALIDEADSQVALPENGGPLFVLEQPLPVGFYVVQAMADVIAVSPELVTCSLSLSGGVWDADTRFIDAGPLVGDPQRMIVTDVVVLPEARSIALLCEATGGNGDGALVGSRSIIATRLSPPMIKVVE